MKKKFFMCSVLLCLLFLFASCTQSQEITEQYVKIDGSYALERFKGTSEQLTFTVQDTYEGAPVTELAEFSLANAEYLEEINLGKNMQKIDSWALTNCNKLKAINVDPDNAYFCSINGVLFTKDRKTLLAYPNNSHGVTFEKTGAYKSFGHYAVPESVEKINDKAFYKCKGLGEIKLPDGLKEIGTRAFTRCENLENILFPAQLEKIEEDAFSFCLAFNNVYIPASVVQIDDYAFFGANNVEKFKMERANGDEMKLSEKWLPVKQKSGSIMNEKTAVEWSVGRENR